jgi:biotin carboxyl carrier protein
MTTATNPPQIPARPFGGRWTYAVLVLALLFVLMPFLFWRATWFGRPLTDEQLEKAFVDTDHPREMQRALSQVADRMGRGDPSVKRWYPRVIELSGSRINEIRVTAAWVMGQDNTVPAFHRALTGVLADAHPMVARNAALSLVRFGDDSGRPLILSMLRPYSFPSPNTGTLRTRLKPGDVVNPGTLIAHIEAQSQSREVRSTVPGTLDRWEVADGTAISEGQPIALLDPSQEMVWEALRALFLVGRSEDLPAIDPYVRGVDGMSPQILQQANATVRAIRSRTASSSSDPR